MKAKGLIIDARAIEILKLRYKLPIAHRMDLPSIALQGLDQVLAQLDAAASGIVDAGATSAGARADTVNLSEEMVALMSAETLYSANSSTLKIADQTQRSLLNVLA